VTKSNGEPVRLVPYNVDWPNIFRLEAAPLGLSLEPFGLQSIEHIGSTAVSGLTAKPIVDILAGVSNVNSLPGRNDPLWASLGYEWGHDTDPPDDWWYFVKRDTTGKRIAQLHVVPFEGEFWNRLVGFRDALRKDQNLVRAQGYHAASRS
jgi:GrpB-like predicted nucleotidyltransferase (UPF0157 family)